MKKSNVKPFIRHNSYCILLLSFVLCLGLFGVNPASAANLPSDLLKQPATEITVNLGNAANELKFEPNHLELVAGKRYLLRLKNPSQLKHYFTAKDFADASWTQKVEAGKVEIKGAIHELELKPTAEAEWVIVPLKAGKYSLRCPIAGHTEAGMTGEIVVNNS
ncbi:cupredoxin domain-containing protein [Nostoc sp. FACHB-152]|uniref:cupredoxin domain-containing protein n=1 Tax=unclassified Nostoc TaxID=2593658 RepID=UPI0016829BE3|nr:MULTISPECIES: cupredoxin domain-containing protein [unclassified Nostoc]MBD2450047.1 cupredoxin domain-containing protein [Nostoc sp. FACHB-152]MBD2470167.1 cupredoxin domain-containing protein [Nostoc sp. FACHB-145]